MKKKNLITIIAATLTIVLLIGLMIAFYSKNHPTTEPIPEITLSPTETPSIDNTITPEITKEPIGDVTIEPTETPTGMVEVTQVPVTPLPEITTEPAETLVPSPVITLEPTVTIAPTATSTPTPTPTGTPTPSPLPTATPTPTAVVEEDDLIVEIQMGDKVWYKIYEGNILVVTGEGATWEFKTSHAIERLRSEYSEIANIETIIIEEGITRIGNCALWGHYNVYEVVIPTSLKEIGEYSFRRVGYYEDTVNWIGLDLTKLKVANNAFYEAVGIADLDGGKDVMAAPTATPTPVPPTPTPTPNPEKPRLVLSEKMGDNITFDFYDNGYLYVRGKGKIYNKKDGFSWLYREQKMGAETFSWGYFPQEFLDSINYLIVEEGVTYVGSWVFGGLDFHHIELPKSLTNFAHQVGINNINASTGNIYIHGYLNEKGFTINALGADGKDVIGYNYFFDFSQIFEYILDEEKIKEYQMTVTWE